jgi:anti-sigma factor RsiW
MKEHESRLSDRELIMAMDGELRPSDADRVESHLEACWTCRSRKRDLEQAIADFVHLHRIRTVPRLPPSAGPRAMLEARLAELAQASPSRWRQPANMRRLSWVTAAAFGFLAAAMVADRYIAEQRAPEVVLATPNPALTPRAALVENPINFCRESMPKNKKVPWPLRRRVLQEYGLTNASARDYEVDYLAVVSEIPVSGDYLSRGG